MVDLPWFVLKESLHRDFGMPIEEEIKKAMGEHKAKLQNRLNKLVTVLIDKPDYPRRLKRKLLQDLVS